MQVIFKLITALYLLYFSFEYIRARKDNKKDLAVSYLVYLIIGLGILFLRYIVFKD